MGVLGKAFEKRAITWNKVYGDDRPPTHSGTDVSAISALKYSVVWAATTLILDAVSGLPPVAFTENEVTGVVTKQKVPAWVRSPHPEMRRSEVFAQILSSAILWGDGFAQITRRSSDNQINGLIPLDPARVTVEWDHERSGTPPGTGIYRRYAIDNGNWLNSKDIFHIQGFTLPGRAKGLSVIGQAREAIGLGLTLEEFGARYFSQGSMHKVVLKSDRMLNSAQARELVMNYERFHRGPRNWHRPAVASGGVDVQNVSIPPEDAQFLQSREFQAIDVARWFRVPPHRVGIIDKQTSWGTGLAEENTATAQLTYRPWAGRLETALTAYAPFGEDQGLQIRLDPKALLKGSAREQIEAWGIAVEKGFATPNEARDNALGLGPIEGGDKLQEPQPGPTEGGGGGPNTAGGPNPH